VTVRYRREGLRIVRSDGAAPPRGEPPWPAAPPPARPEAPPPVRGFKARILADARRSGVAQRVAAVYPHRAILLARKLAGKSQRELAAELGMSRSMLAGCETGTRTIPYALARWAAGVFAKGTDG
jgi:DNA-binding XRE family transcriptional regulator